ncbi:MAG TPA: hypothetical protein VGP36_24885 [Mycobacteriales bacterium]|jgi:hypothetical protein|nr:hypothetical protein [Mycobacteriales bacterium]
MTGVKPLSRPVRHHSSHTGLLAVAQGGNAPLSGIVVPAGRPTENLEPALRLSAQLQTPILILCSLEAVPGDVAELAAGIPGTQATVVDLTDPSDGVLPQLATSKFHDGTMSAVGDLSLKRNIGLVAGRACGWRSVLFLDDDVRDLNARVVRRAAGSLEHYAAVGMPATSYPDNSVVCHARRLVFDDQDVFVSGSALAVDLDRVCSFFPQVYNEDWLFLAPHLQPGHRAVARSRAVQQIEYDPFKVQRARAEEFGDVLAEGLVGSLHSGAIADAMAVGYWDEFFDHRLRFIREAVDPCYFSGAIEAAEALETADTELQRLSPRLAADYLWAWQDDLDTWQRYLANVRIRGYLVSALGDLGLTPVRPDTRSGRRRTYA